MSRVLKTLSIAGAALTLVALPGCSSDWKVKRVDPTAQTDLDYRFNDQDARQIAQEIAADSLSRPWIEAYLREHGDKRPIVYLASVKNNTQDYIDSQIFTDQIEEAFINSGKVRVKAERQARQELRDERLDTKYNDPATVKAIAKEINADFALMGSISDNKQRSTSGNTVVSYYQANLELVNVETAEIVWKKPVEIKKVARR